MVSFIFSNVASFIFSWSTHYQSLLEMGICNLSLWRKNQRRQNLKKINDTIIFSFQKYLLDMGLILDNNGENIVLCPAMVYVGSK